MADAPTRPTRAVVTGAAQGIGLAVARRLVDEGLRTLTLVDLNADGLAEAAKEIRDRAEGVEVHEVAADLVDIESAAKAVADAVGDAPLDVLVNAAGVTTRGGLHDITLAKFDALMAINVRAPLFLAQALAPRMGRGATIVNVTSMLAHGGPPFLLGYAASKSALVTLTKGIANTLKRDGVRAFGINLGWTVTPAERDVQTREHGLAPDWVESLGKEQPFGRLLMPEDPAGLVAFLISKDAAMMTGAIIDLDQFVAGTVEDNPGAA